MVIAFGFRAGMVLPETMDESRMRFSRMAFAHFREIEFGKSQKSITGSLYGTMEVEVCMWSFD